MSLQIATVIGNATKDAELKSSKEGINYLSFRLGVSGPSDRSTFYNVIVFGKYGETLLEHVKRGREIFASGKLEISDKGYVSLVADHIQLLRWPKGKDTEMAKSSAAREVKTVQMESAGAEKKM